MEGKTGKRPRIIITIHSTSRTVLASTMYNAQCTVLVYNSTEVLRVLVLASSTRIQFGCALL
jgi:hypothetical protein